MISATLDRCIPKHLPLLEKCRLAVAEANETEFPVTFRHNGRPVTAFPGDTPELLVEGVIVPVVPGEMS